MTQTIQRKLNDSALARWGAMVLIALMMLFAHMFVDVISPIKELIQIQRGWTSDVFVWHKVYGRMHAPLNIYSRAQVKQFIDGVRTGKSTELMAVTGGYHYHTIRAESESVLDQIEKALSEKGFLAPGE